MAYKGQEAVILAIPRGGVIVAVEVQKALGAPLDLVIPRKIPAPGNPELAIGAVAGPGKVVISEELRRSLGVGRDYVDDQVRRQLQEIERRRQRYLDGKAPIPLEGKTAIIVDDGLATGSTAKAAIVATRAKRPGKIVLAVPVAPADTLDRLGREVDEAVCLSVPDLFYAVGQFYADFPQTSDEEVVDALSTAQK